MWRDPKFKDTYAYDALDTILSTSSLSIIIGRLIGLSLAKLIGHSTVGDAFNPSLIGALLLVSGILIHSEHHRLRSVDAVTDPRNGEGRFFHLTGNHVAIQRTTRLLLYFILTIIVVSYTLFGLKIAAVVSIALLLAGDIFLLTKQFTGSARNPEPPTLDELIDKGASFNYELGLWHLGIIWVSTIIFILNLAYYWIYYHLPANYTSLSELIPVVWIIALVFGPIIDSNRYYIRYPVENISSAAWYKGRRLGNYIGVFTIIFELELAQLSNLFVEYTMQPLNANSSSYFDTTMGQYIGMLIAGIVGLAGLRYKYDSEKRSFAQGLTLTTTWWAIIGWLLFSLLRLLHIEVTPYTIMAGVALFTVIIVVFDFRNRSRR